MGPAKDRNQPTAASRQSAEAPGSPGYAFGHFIGSVAKSLLISAIVIGACIGVMQVNMTLGIIMMMLYSSYMVIKSARKDMPLNKFTALLPGVISIFTFLIMLGLIKLYDPAMPMIGMGLGVVVGFLMARGHKVYRKKGILFAKRTLLYMVLWALSLLFTQGSTLAGAREITDFGFLLNGFSTAMMVVLSVFLFIKASGGPKAPKVLGSLPETMMLLALVPFLMLFTQPALAFTVNGTDNVEISRIAGEYVFQQERGHLPKNLVIHLSKTDKTYGYRLGLRTQRKHRGSALFILQYKKPQRKADYIFNLFEDVYKSEKTKFKDAQRFSLGAGGKGYLYYGRWYKARETGRRIKQGQFRVPETIRGALDYIDCLAILDGNNWFLEVKIRDYPGDQDTFFGRDHERACKSTIARIVQRLQSIQVSAAAPSESNTDPAPYNPPPQSENISTPNSDFEFSSDEEAAGVLLAILMLLGSVSINVATGAVTSVAATAAQEAANQAMTAGSDDSPPYNDQGGPVLLDPDYGDPLIVQDGSYEGGEIGQVWYDGQWMDRDEATQKVDIRQQEIDRENRENEKYLDDFQKQNEREWEQKMADREQKLRDEHNIFDEDEQAWVKDPNYTPPRTDLEEFYERIDYIDEHRHERSEKEQEAIDRILDRTGYKDGTISEDDLSKEDLETIKKLSHVLLDKESGETIGKEARDWGTEAGHYEDLASGVKKVGQVSSEALEKYYTNDTTKGAITEFIFSAASNHDKDIWKNIEDSGLSSINTASGNLTGGLSKSAGWRVFNNVAWAGGEEIAKGSDAKTTAQAILERVAAGELKKVFGDLLKDYEINKKISDLLKKSSLQLSDEAISDAFDNFTKLSSQLDTIKTD